MNNSLIRFPFLETPLGLGRLAHLTSPSAHDVIVALETEKPLVTTSGSFWFTVQCTIVFKSKAHCCFGFFWYEIFFLNKLKTHKN